MNILIANISAEFNKEYVEIWEFPSANMSAQNYIGIVERHSELGISSLCLGKLGGNCQYISWIYHGICDEIWNFPSANLLAENYIGIIEKACPFEKFNFMLGQTGL